MKIILILLIIIVSFSLILYMYCHFENRKFRVTEYNIFTDKIEKDMTLCVISDLHNYSYGDDNSRLMLEIDKMKPDMVVSAGDMIEAGVCAKGSAKTVDFLAALQKKYPFFYGIGNHETMLYNEEPHKYDKVRKEYFDAIKKYAENGVDIAPLRDDCLELLDYNINLISLDVETKYFRKFKLREFDKDYIEKKVGRINTERFNIMVGHDPHQIKAYAAAGADLVLSGHVHGGMIALPNGRGLVSTLFTPFPPYYAGIYRENNTVMIVSRGIGNHSVHVRINNRAEILKVNLIRED